MSWRPLVFDHGWLKLFSLVLATLIWLSVHAGVGDDPGTGRKRTREFLNRPVLFLTESGHQPLMVEPAQVKVFVQGPVSLLNELKEQDIQVFVNVSSGRSNDTVPVRVHVPSGVTVSHIVPSTVTIRPANLP